MTFKNFLKEKIETYLAARNSEEVVKTRELESVATDYRRKVEILELKKNADAQAAKSEPTISIEEKKV